MAVPPTSGKWFPDTMPGEVVDLIITHLEAPFQLAAIFSGIPFSGHVAKLEPALHSARVGRSIVMRLSMDLPDNLKPMAFDGAKRLIYDTPLLSRASPAQTRSVAAMRTLSARMVQHLPLLPTVYLTAWYLQIRCRKDAAGSTIEPCFASAAVRLIQFGAEMGMGSSCGEPVSLIDLHLLVLRLLLPELTTGKCVIYLATSR